MENENKEVPKTYKFLGYGGDTNYIYSYYKDSVLELTSSDFTETRLVNLIGPTALQSYVQQKFNPKTGSITQSYDMFQLRNDLIEGCHKAGSFKLDQVRGIGVYKDGKDLIVNTNKIWSTNPFFDKERLQKNAVYLKNGYLLNKDIPECTKEEAKIYLSLDENFNFRKAQDTKLVSGWKLHAFLSGALPWLSHLSLTGGPGTGKSTWLKVTKLIQSKNMILLDGDTTAAGLRIKLGTNAVCVALDEAEASNSKMNSHVALFRSANDGKEILRGSSSQTVNTYKVKFPGVLAGVIPPNLNETDAGRFICVELAGVNKGFKNTSTDIIQNIVADDEDAIEFLKVLGQKMFMFMIKNFDLYQKAAVDIKRELIINSSLPDRNGATLSPVLASYYILENFILDRKQSAETVKEFLKDFNFDYIQAYKEDSEQNSILKIILQKNFDCPEFIEERRKVSISELVKNFYESSNNLKNQQEINKFLGMWGMRLTQDTVTKKVYLNINQKHSMFNNFFKDTKFTSGNIAQVIARLPICTLNTKAMKINHVQVRGCLVLDLESEVDYRNNIKEESCNQKEYSDEEIKMYANIDQKSKEVDLSDEQKKDFGK